MAVSTVTDTTFTADVEQSDKGPKAVNVRKV